MSVKVLEIIDKHDVTQLDWYDNNDDQTLVITTNGQSCFYNRSQAQMIYLYLKERFENDSKR